MSFISELTWKCIELQSSLENPEVGEQEKNELIVKHLNSLEESSSRDVFPEFETGLEWFNTKRALTVDGDLRNQLVVVDFFTYCCINCMHILPDLHALEEKYPSEETGLVVVGVHSAKFENEKVSGNILAAIQRYGIHHPVVNDGDAILWKKLEITCWPTLLILGPDTKPLFVIVGEGHREVLFRYVERALLHFTNQITPRCLPLSVNNPDVIQSHLLFPGKVCLIDCEAAKDSSGSPDIFCGEHRLLAVSDTGHHRILIVSLEGEVKVKIGGPAAGFQDGSFVQAKFRSPQGLVFLPPNKLFVADTGNHSVRLVDLRSKEVQTVAGTGIQSTDKEGGRFGKQQPLASPWDLCLISSAPTLENPDLLVIANAGTHQIWGLALESLTWWKNVKLEAGQCFRIAGSGAEENRNNSYPVKAAFAQPSGLCCATVQSRSTDYVLFVADSESSSIRQVNLKDGSVKAVVGGDKDPMNLFRYGDLDNREDSKGPVLFQHPLGVAWNSKSQRIYVTDSYNHKIKIVDPVAKVSYTYCGNGKAGLSDGTLDRDEIQFNEPGGLCIDSDLNLLFVVDTNNHCIRKIDLLQGTTHTLKISQESPDVTQTVTQPDFELSARLCGSSKVEWTISFHCPTDWKWSEDAPHTWKIKHHDGVEVLEKTGAIKEGQMKIVFLPLTNPINSDKLFVQVHSDLFLCALGSGVCTKKSVVIQLNVVDKSFDDEEARNIHSTFDINAN